MDVQPGYVGFSKSEGLMGKLIRVGERLHGKGDVNHMFVVGENNKVIQAEMKGVTYDAYLDNLFALDPALKIVKPPEHVRLNDVVWFAAQQVGIDYGLGTDVAIGVDMMTAQWVPAMRGARKPSWICSALGAESLRFAGWYHQWIDIYTPTPQMVLDALLDEGGVLV